MTEGMLIKEVTELGDIYTNNLDAQMVRYRDIISKFKAVYGRNPDFLARSPGRVNIIGEHIDYCGFGVLPMGVERDIVTAVSVGAEVSDGEVVLRLASSKSGNYPSCDVKYSEKDTVVISNGHDWTNYAKAGFKGIVTTLGIKPKSMACLVDGTIPAGGGLSSSSALVCSLAMAAAYAQGKMLDATEVATIAVEAERLVGVNGGGMDQACSMLSQKDSALYITFSPIIASPVPLPLSPPMNFVVANSLVVSDKAVTAPRNYNLRVVETRLAAAILSKHLNITDKVGEYPTLKDIVENIPENLLSVVEDEVDRNIYALEVLLKYSKKIFLNQEKGYDLSELCECLELSEKEISSRFLSRFPVETTHFHLHKRVQHVLSEAQRVLQFKFICLTSPKEAYQQLAKLMNSSHASCRDLFDCSCPELENLVSVCHRHGALSARLTGAGWGGCVISLVPTPQLNSFLKGLHQDFYPHLSEEEFSSACFATQPAQGAVYLTKLESFN